MKTVFIPAIALIVLLTGMESDSGQGFVNMAMASRPRNPARPMTATNCHQALQRLREAVTGSPIIDAEQNRQHVLDAMDQVERLCADRGKDERQK